MLRLLLLLLEGDLNLGRRQLVPFVWILTSARTSFMTLDSLFPLPVSVFSIAGPPFHPCVSHKITSSSGYPPHSYEVKQSPLTFQLQFFQKWNLGFDQIIFCALLVS